MSGPIEGFCYTAFMTDVFSRKVVGWGVSSTMHTLGMPLTALKQGLKALGVQLSVGSTGDSYDNALAESVNGAYKAEMVRDRLLVLLVSWSLRLLAGWFGGMLVGCIRGLGLELRRRWLMVL